MSSDDIVVEGVQHTLARKSEKRLKISNPKTKYYIIGGGGARRCEKPERCVQLSQQKNRTNRGPAPPKLQLQ